MPLLSCFTPCGMLTLSSEPSHAQPIYETMIASLGGAFKVTQGTHIEASIYARAMALAELRYLLEHAGGQVTAAGLDEMLGLREEEYEVVPGPADTLAERRAVIAARKLLSRGARRESIEGALSALLGSLFVGLRACPPAEILNTPTTLGDQPANLQLPTVRRCLYRLTTAISTGLGAPQSVAFTAVDPPGAVPLVGDVIVIEPEIDGITERVTVTAVAGSTLTATFTNPHTAAALATSAPYPYWTGTQRASLIFVTDAAAIDPETRRKLNELLERMMRAPSTWAIVQGTGASAGPFTLDASPLDATPFDALTIPA